MDSLLLKTDELRLLTIRNTIRKSGAF